MMHRAAAGLVILALLALAGFPLAIVAIRWRRRVRAHAGRRPGSKETLPANQYHGSK